MFSVKTMLPLRICMKGLNSSMTSGSSVFHCGTSATTVEHFLQVCQTHQNQRVKRGLRTERWGRRSTALWRITSVQRIRPNYRSSCMSERRGRSRTSYNITSDWHTERRRRRENEKRRRRRRRRKEKRERKSKKERNKQRKRKKKTKKKKKSTQGSREYFS